MEKRIFLAILVSVAVLWGWAALAPKMFPEIARDQERRSAQAKKQPARANAPAPATPANSTGTAVPGTPNPALSPAPPVSPVAAEREQVITVDAPDFVAHLSNRGAQLVSFRLKKYLMKDGSQVDLVKARSRNRADYPFAIESRDANLAKRANGALYSVTDTTDRGARLIQFRYAEASGLSITKTFRFTGEYQFHFTSQVSPDVPYRVIVGPGIRTLDAGQQDSQVVITGNGVVQTEGKFVAIKREKGDRLRIFPGVDFIGIEDNYFLTAMKPESRGDATLRRVEFLAADKKNNRKDLYAGVNSEAGRVETTAFFGPKEASVVERYGYERSLQFGWFGIIARFFLRALLWINQYTLNFGWAIVVLTVGLKLVLYPLQYKSIVSMKKMQKLQPKMEAIKSKYKKAKTDPDQRQKMNVDMMKLYSDEGINPMSGCFPILLQLPILWGFYGLLSRAIELRGAPWILWIHDLSDKDPYYITPILMTATMFIQTWITPATGDPSQRKIFLMMPLIFGFLFKDFPSGLVLYWLVQNILTIAQQLIMNKYWKDHPEEIQKA